jgi:flagellar motor component MotA
MKILTSQEGKKNQVLNENLRVFLPNDENKRMSFYNEVL